LLKVVKTDTYAIMFDQSTGEEIMSGINGHEDPFSLRYPSLMDIGIMGHCQNDCYFCYQGEEQEPNMKLDDFKKIIDQSGEVNQIALGGRGDPNKHENFEEIIDYAVVNGIIPNYTTSGIDLTDTEVEVSKMCGAVAVSDYGRDFTYDALNKFIDAGIKTNIHQVLSKYTFEKSSKILLNVDVWEGKFDRNKLNAIIFLLFKPQGRGKNLNDHVLDKQQIKDFRYLTKTATDLPFKIGMDSCMVNMIKQVDSLSSEERIYMDTCEGARMSTYISPNMLLMPCSFGCRDDWGVDINETPIREAWNSELFELFRSKLSQKDDVCPFGF